MHSYFDSSGTLEFVESFLPKTFSFQGQLLVGRPVSEVLQHFEAHGFQAEYDLGTHILYDAGIALYVDDDVLAASAFRQGYYDEP